MPAIGDFSSDIVAGDVDADGDLDPVVANARNYWCGAGSNRLYVNDGAGVITASILPGTARSTYSVVLGDVDGDGDMEIVVGNYNVPPYGSGPSRLLLNDGAGRFSETAVGRLS